MSHINPAKGDFDIVIAGNRATRWRAAKKQGVSLFAFNNMEIASELRDRLASGEYIECAGCSGQRRLMSLLSALFAVNA